MLVHAHVSRLARVQKLSAVLSSGLSSCFLVKCGATSFQRLSCNLVIGCRRSSQVLGGLLAGVVAIAAPRADAIEIIDGTKLRQSGFDIIYNARDLDKSQVRIARGLEPTARSNCGEFQL
jgi:hypothetical protein